jgi:hypothetical protein
MTQDYNMWVRMMKWGYDFVNHPVCLTRYRIHENQGSIKKKSAFHKEIQQAQGYILNNFTPVEIQQKSNSSLHKNILYLYLKFIFFKQNRIGQITELTQKIWIYTILAPVYRKLFIK